ncbi:MAG TPA: metal-dependent transcriptional regulator, partial [Mycobacterium sp.]|nr:metal-dependent transcriptional regulator [Mycobacterium sp.]
MPKLSDVSPDETPNSGVRDLTMVAQDYLKVIWTAQEWSHEKVSTK